MNNKIELSERKPPWPQIDVHYQHLYEGTEENHETPEWEQPVCKTKLEPWVFLLAN